MCFVFVYNIGVHKIVLHVCDAFFLFGTGHTTKIFSLLVFHKGVLHDILSTRACAHVCVCVTPLPMPIHELFSSHSLSLSLSLSFFPSAAPTISLYVVNIKCLDPIVVSIAVPRGTWLF